MKDLKFPNIKNIPSPKQVKEWKEKSKKYDQLEKIVASYFAEDESKEVGDICDLGEDVCREMGYM